LTQYLTYVIYIVILIQITYEVHIEHYTTTKNLQ